jgi:hypothetical protein
VTAGWRLLLFLFARVGLPMRAVPDVERVLALPVGQVEGEPVDDGGIFQPEVEEVGG